MPPTGTTVAGVRVVCSDVVVHSPQVVFARCKRAALVCHLKLYTTQRAGVNVRAPRKTFRGAPVMAEREPYERYDGPITA